MNLFWFCFRLFKKIRSIIRKRVFVLRIKDTRSDVCLIGNVDLRNTNVTLGRGVVLYPNVVLWGDGPIEIGDNTAIGDNVMIFGSSGGGVKIGSNTLIAAQCYIIDLDHGIEKDKLISEQEDKISPVKIGSGCWLGANVTVTKGAIIEDGAIIGAKSLVRGYIPPNAIAAGIPAKVIKYRE